MTLGVALKSPSKKSSDTCKIEHGLRRKRLLPVFLDPIFLVHTKKHRFFCHYATYLIQDAGWLRGGNVLLVFNEFPTDHHRL